MDILSETLDAITINKINAIFQKNGIDPSGLINKDEMESVGFTLKEQLENFKEYIGELMFDKIVAGGSLMPTLDRWHVEVMDRNIEKITSRFYEKMQEYDKDISYEEVKAFAMFLLQLGGSGAPQ